MRLFAALPLPYELGIRLERLQSGIPEGRAVPAEDLHLTLGFFDECNRHVAEEIDAGFSSIQVPEFLLWVDGIGLFGDQRRTTLHVQVRPVPELLRLRDKVLNVARRAGIALPRERFVPHVTLARLGPGAEAGQRMQGWIARNAGFAAGPFATGAFCLFRSDLGNGGPVYTELARYGSGPAALLGLSV